MSDRTERLRRMLVAGERGRRADSVEATEKVESVPEGEPLPRDNSVLGRAEAALTAARDAGNADRDAFDRALSQLRRSAGPVLAKLTEGGAVAATPDEAAALEAVVIADGTRPSFLLRDGAVAPDDPFLGTWRDPVAAHGPALRAAARAVGRVQPGGGHAGDFLGTAVLIDRDRGLALTNYHVVDDATTKRGVAMERRDRSIAVTGMLEVDFDGEAHSLSANRFRVAAVDLPEGFGRGHGAVDAAVLRLEPLDGGHLPEAVGPFSAAAHLAQGATRSLATIGFPGPTPRAAGREGGVDWAFVTDTLFGGRFGLKRLAPGVFTLRLGSHGDDRARTAFGHDATTFGGASGSPVIAWSDTGRPVFGLHFAGRTESANYALSAAAARGALEAVGVRFA